MKKKLETLLLVIAFVLLSTVGVIISCSKSDSVSPVAGTPINMGVTFSKAGAVNGLLKTSGVTAIDSVRVDSAVVIFQKIKFESHIDTVSVDTTGQDLEDDSKDANITLKGPFVVHVRDTSVINFAGQVLPAGTYDGIKFKIHRLNPGEHHEDSDEFNHRVSITGSDTAFIGSSIVVWGAVYQNAAWVPFTLKLAEEVEFKIKGSFLVAEAMGTVKIALNFNMGLWFKNPDTGTLLDPTDTSPTNVELFYRAVRLSFGQGRGGHDWNGDGHPDD